jgi:thioester reductase-like protein
MTGATGFIGKKILNSLLRSYDNIFVLIRPESIPRFEKNIINKEKITIIPADISQEDVFLSEEDRELVQSNCQHILHLAALYDLTSDQFDSYMANVLGTQNILSLASSMPDLKYFHYVSTVAVAGDYKGRYPEDRLLEKVKHTNNYGKTKMVAESLVRQRELQGVKKRIYRPGIIVGEISTGDFEKIDGPYYFLKFLFQFSRKHKFSKKIPYIPFPFSKRAELPLVPVDLVVNWLDYMVSNPVEKHDIRTYHLVSEYPLAIHRFIDEAFRFVNASGRAVALNNFGIWEKLIEKMGMPSELVGYLYMPTKFRPINRLVDFPELKDMKFEVYKNQFFRAAQKQLDLMH